MLSDPATRLVRGCNRMSQMWSSGRLVLNDGWMGRLSPEEVRIQLARAATPRTQAATPPRLQPHPGCNPTQAAAPHFQAAAPVHPCCDPTHPGLQTRAPGLQPRAFKL